MASFTGQLIKDTYDSILKAIDNGVIDSTAKNITDGVGNVTPLYISTTQVGIGVTPSTDFHVNGSALIGGSLTITGDLTVNGSTTTISTQTLSVEDPLIILAKDNAANSVDIGFYGKYVDGSTKYAGLFRKAGDNKFHIFSGLGTEPTTTVNTSDASYVISTLVGNLEGNVTGNIIATGAGATQIMSDVRAVTQSANDNSTKIATTAYVDSSAGNYLPLAGGTMSGNIAMGGNNISNVGDITLAATKRLKYADNKIIIGTTNSTLGSEAISIGYDADSTGNQSIGIGYNPEASGTYSVAIGYNVTASGTGTFVFGTSGSHSDNNTLVASGLDLKVTGTGQSSFAGQVTIPATPVADTDAASKGYVDSQVGANNELSEVLANGNTTGGTDIAITSGDKITNFTSTGIDDNATSTALTIDTSNNATFAGNVTGGNGTFTNLTIDATEKLRFDGSGGHTYIEEDSNDTLIFATGGTTRLTLDANATFAGNVSLISSSTVNLRVTDGTQNIYVGSSGSTRFGLSSGASIIQSTGASFGIGTQDGNDFILGANNTAALTLDVNQNAIFASAVWMPDYLYHHGDADTYMGYPTNNEWKVTVGGSTKIFADSNKTYLYYQGGLKLQTTSSGIEVTGDGDFSGQIFVGAQNSTFAENNLRFKSAGAAYIDHNTVGQSFIFRTSASSSLDTTALTIESDADATFGGDVNATGDNKQARFGAEYK